MSLLQALDEEQRQVLKDLEEQKNKNQKPEGQGQTEGKDKARPVTFKISGNRPKSAMSAVYGRGQLPDPLRQITGRRNSTPDLSGDRQPHSSSSRERPGSPGSSLLSPTYYTNPSKGTRRGSDVGTGSSEPLSKGDPRLREGTSNGGKLGAAQAEDDSIKDDESDVDSEEKARGRGRLRSTKTSPGVYGSESRSPSQHETISFPNDPNRN